MHVALRDRHVPMVGCTLLIVFQEACPGLFLCLDEGPERTRLPRSDILFGQLMSSTRAVIVPGIMGSALTYKGHEIWGDNLFANIKRLTENPSVLKWDGRRADARLIHTIQISTI